MAVYFETGMSSEWMFRRPRPDWLGALGTNGEPILLSRGRDCLYVACRALGLEAGSRILVPAFICHDVVRLLQRWRYEVVLYDVNADLTLDLEQMRRRLTADTGAILYANYFGFQHSSVQLQELRDFAVPLIEDNCQAPFGQAKGRPLPDLAFTSLRKYLPVPDGAVLDVIKPSLRDKLANLRSVTLRGRLNSSRTAALAVRALQQRRDRRIPAEVAQELFAKAQRRLRSESVPLGMHWLSRLMASRMDVGAVYQRRREHYAILAAALGTVSGMTVVRPGLGDSDCPYCLPTMVRDSRLWCDALNHHRIQAALLWDWQRGLDDYPVTQQLATHLLSLPVAQGNRPEWITSAIATIRGYNGD